MPRRCSWFPREKSNERFFFFFNAGFISKGWNIPPILILFPASKWRTSSPTPGTQFLGLQGEGMEREFQDLWSLSLDPRMKGLAENPRKTGIHPKGHLEMEHGNSRAPGDDRITATGFTGCWWRQVIFQFRVTTGWILAMAFSFADIRTQSVDGECARIEG